MTTSVELTTMQASGATARPPARISFVFDMDVLLTTQGSETAQPGPGVINTLLHLQHHHIPFVILFNGVRMQEQDIADMLNTHFSLPRDISWRSIGVATSPMRDMPQHCYMKSVLVIGGNGEDARKLAWDYGFEFVLTTSEFAYFYPKYAKYRSPATIPLEERRKEKRWIMKERRHFHIEAIFAMWEPDNWDRDTDITIDLLLNGGKIDQPFEIPSAMHGSDRLTFIRKHAPSFHVFSGGVPDRFGTKDNQETSWLGHLRAEWAKHPCTYPPLNITQCGTQPMTQPTTRYAEGLVARANALAAAAEQGIDPREAVQTPNPKTVYLVGAQRHRRYFSRFGARWLDILVQGQEISLHAEPWHVAPDVRAAVDHAMAEEYWDCCEAGWGPVWPRPMTERPAPPVVEVEEKGGSGWFAGVWKGLLRRTCGCWSE